MDRSERAIFGDLRALLHGPPSPAAWRELCALIDPLDPSAPAVAYARDRLLGWPPELRARPPGALPGGAASRLAATRILRGPDPVWGVEHRAMRGSDDGVACLALHRATRSVFVAPRLHTEAPAHPATLYDAESGEARGELPRAYLPRGAVVEARFSDNGEALATLHRARRREETTLALWDAASASLLWEERVGRGSDEVAIALSAAGDYVAIAHARSGEVEVRDARSGRRELSLIESSRGVLPLDFAPDGSYVATHVRDAAPIALAFAPDAARLAVAYRTGTLRVWSLEECEIEAEASWTPARTATLRWQDDLLSAAQPGHAARWTWDGDELIEDEAWRLSEGARALLGAQTIALLDGHHVRVLDGAPRATLFKEGYRFETAALDETGQAIALANAESLWIWELDS